MGLHWVDTSLLCVSVIGVKLNSGGLVGNTYGCISNPYQGIRQINDGVVHVFHTTVY